MIRSILVDDEVSCTDILQWQLSKYCTQVEIVGIYNDTLEALNQITTIQPELVFLDIEMPGMNAFELLEKLKPIPFDIIFITAYNQFAVQAFKENAIDYLLKPIEKSDLVFAVDKVYKKQATNTTERIDALLKLFKVQLEANKRIALPTNNGISFIDVEQIVHCVSDNNYTFVHLANGSRVLITKTLKQIEESLITYPFYRVHQSHLVNLNHIIKFVKDQGGFLLMSDNSTITVARQRKEGLMELFSKL
ncbi:MAG: response regulator transcription factor [Bacteroidetes bacterium]|nr:response regulator transcription factor [Bacteroidota bacterium]